MHAGKDVCLAVRRRSLGSWHRAQVQSRQGTLEVRQITYHKPDRKRKTSHNGGDCKNLIAFPHVRGFEKVNHLNAVFSG